MVQIVQAIKCSSSHLRSSAQQKNQSINSLLLRLQCLAKECKLTGVTNEQIKRNHCRYKLGIIFSWDHYFTRTRPRSLRTPGSIGGTSDVRSVSVEIRQITHKLTFITIYSQWYCCPSHRSIQHHTHLQHGNMINVSYSCPVCGRYVSNMCLRCVQYVSSVINCCQPFLA